MKRRWVLAPLRTDLAGWLSSQLNVHPIIGHLLANRDVDSIERGQAFLNRRLGNLHDPDQMPGIGEAADRIFAAVSQKKMICIYGDYDVDGMCATAILLEVLRLGGGQCRFYVPDRLEEGYGVNADSLAKLRQEGVDLVVTVDCGIASVTEAIRARELGLEYIVTDHHELGPEIPAADAVVHPRLPGSQYPFGELCGAGVAFKLAWEVARRFSGDRRTSDQFRDFLLNATILAAIGTICDIVPLVGENRILAYHGLKALPQRAPVGLKALLEVAELGATAELGSDDIAFRLGPRLNACGRLGQARLGVDLLTTRDPVRAGELARYLNEENKVRQSLERKIFTSAREMVEARFDFNDGIGTPAIVLDSDDWHVGVIGIVASRLVERFHRPCVLVSWRDGQNVGTGSGRSIPGFDLHAALSACATHLEKSGGHAMAAGLRLRREQFSPFAEAFCRQAQSTIQRQQLIGDLRVDAEVPLHALRPALLKQLQTLEPFGLKNPSPTFLSTNVELVDTPTRVGGGERHLRFRVRQGKGTPLGAIAFGQGERLEELCAGAGRCCLVFRPVLREYRGFLQVQLQVKDFRAGERADTEVLE